MLRLQSLHPDRSETATVRIKLTLVEQAREPAA